MTDVDYFHHISSLIKSENFKLLTITSFNLLDNLILTPFYSQHSKKDVKNTSELKNNIF